MQMGLLPKTGGEFGGGQDLEIHEHIFIEHLLSTPVTVQGSGDTAVDKTNKNKNICPCRAPGAYNLVK